MSSLGYALESEIEDFFLSFTGQNKHDPILMSDDKGMIRLNRTFRIPTSGAMDSMAGDVVTCIPWLPRQFKVECKSRYEKTKKDGSIIFLEHEWIKKNNEEAETDHQMPLLAFTFKKVKKDRLWWMVKQEDFHKLVHSVSFDQHTRAWNMSNDQTSYLPNKKGDKTRLVHSHLSQITDGVQTLIINEERYILLRHSEFTSLMKSHKSNDEKFKRQVKETMERRRSRQNV